MQEKNREIRAIWKFMMVGTTYEIRTKQGLSTSLKQVEELSSAEVTNNVCLPRIDRMESSI